MPSKEEIENKRAEDRYLKLTLIFYKDKKISRDTWGSNSIVYNIDYSYNNGIMNVWEIGAFGDSTLVKRFWDKRKRGITESEMLENIQEISNMTYKEFKEKILKGEKEV